MAGDSLAPTTYQAVATYTGTGYRKVPTGYTSTSEYFGEISYSQVESITYKVTYPGEEITGETSLIPGNVDTPAVPGHKSSVKEAAIPALPYVAGGLAAAAIITLVIMPMRSRRELWLLQEPEDDSETEHEMEENEQ